MKLNGSVNELLNVADKVAFVIPKEPSKAVMRGLMIAADAERKTVTVQCLSGTVLASAVSESFSVEETGRACLPYTEFIGALQRSEQADFALVADEHQAELTLPRCMYKFGLIQADDFPAELAQPSLGT